MGPAMSDKFWFVLSANHFYFWWPRHLVPDNLRAGNHSGRHQTVMHWLLLLSPGQGIDFGRISTLQPSQTQITAVLQAGVIMQLYAKLGTMSTHSSPDKKSEIHSDMALDIWSLSEIRAKVHQFLAKIKLFFSNWVNILFEYKNISIFTS